MLKTIQLIALIQGIFLTITLFKKRRHFKVLPLNLLLACIISIILFILGDDENNLFVEGEDWFLFDNSLFITFLLLFSIYYKDSNSKFNPLHYLFFIPSIIYFSIESIEQFVHEGFYLEVTELLVESILTVYLLYIIIFFFRSDNKSWLVYFASPVFILLIITQTSEFLPLFGVPSFVEDGNKYLNTALHLTIAFLFYFIVYNLVLSKKEFLPEKVLRKYSNSHLTTALIQEYKSKLLQSMEEEKIFIDKQLSLESFSKATKIPKQYISEILNKHMETNFLDFVNSYRIEEFIKLMNNGEFKNYSIYGLANEVGFNSKSTFNSIFKKVKGKTPSEYKRTSTLK